MKITFVLPCLSTVPVGGFKVVFEYANRFAALGDTVTLCYLSPLDSGPIGRFPLPMSAKSMMTKGLVNATPTWFNLDSRILKRWLPVITDDEIPDSDWIIATAIETVKGVRDLSKGKGKKAYLIQDFEDWACTSEEVRETYKWGLRNIVVSQWLRDIVDEASGVKSIYMPNPVDTEVFSPMEGVEREQHTIASLYHQSAHKGFKYAWNSIVQAKELIPDLRLELFGVFRRPHNLPNWVTYTRRANETQLRKIYSRSAAYVCASINEGFGLTCVESMACGCALVVSDFPGSRDYARDGVNALVSPTGEVQMMTENLVNVLTDEALRSRLSMQGREDAQSRNWNDSALRLHEVLLFER